MIGGNAISQRRTESTSLLAVWDTHCVPPREAFALYGETISKVYMPWSAERNCDGAFQARIETARIGNGSVSSHRCTPHASVRTAHDVANSPIECCYLVRVLSGQLKCEQGESSTVAQAGDTLLFDSAQPAKTWMGRSAFHALVITVPKSELTGATKMDCRLSNTLLKQDRTPLSKCLILMANLMPSASKDEISALYQAVRSLLPIEAGCFDGDADVSHGNINLVLRGILGHIDQNIANTDLTPHHVARQFGISVRYVHKLFIGCGMTFRSYTTARRLDYVCKDLTSPASRQQPISLVAFRWGFNDLSSFNRAFKSRYGCTPTQYRNWGGETAPPNYVRRFKSGND